MISAQQIATLTISRLIFHDLPRKRAGIDTQPVLSEIDSELDPDITRHIRDSLTRTVGKIGYEIQFKPTPFTSVPSLVRGYLAAPTTPASFVTLSRTLAESLFDLQTGAMSAGLMAVIECAVDGRPGLGILKLEREEGAQLDRVQRNGKKTFKMAVLRNLVLTEGTKLFKNALFVRVGPGFGPDDFDAGACDNQRWAGAPDELAQFWLRFLGCELREEPRVTTKRLFETSKQYIHEAITDPVEKNTFYEHVVSELKAQRRDFCALAFLEHYVPPEHQTRFREYLAEHHVPLTPFPIDLTEIGSALRRKAFHTARGATISVPSDEAEMVRVETDRVIVSDCVTRVDTK
jgi:hypothetical protein